MVPESGYEAAHEMLVDSELASQAPVPGQMPGIGSPAKLAAGLLAAAALAALLVWILYQLSS